MGEAFRFFRRHLIASLFGATGVIFAALGYADQARAIRTTFEPWQLQALGASLFVVFVVMVLISYGRSPQAVPISAADPNFAAKQAQRRKVLADGRRLVAEFNLQARQRTLIGFLQYREEWPAIRAHLDAKVRNDLENARLAVSAPEGLKDGKVTYLMNELDRLEREWDLA